MSQSAHSLSSRPDELRPVSITRGFTKYAEGSVLMEAGGTRVLCTASVTPGVPPFLRGKGDVDQVGCQHQQQAAAHDVQHLRHRVMEPGHQYKNQQIPRRHADGEEA